MPPSQILTACSCYQAPAEKADEELLWSVVHGRASVPLSEDVCAVLARHVAANAQALELLHAAADIEPSRYPVDFKKGYAITLSHTGDVINKAEFLAAVELAHRAAQGDAGRRRAVDADVSWQLPIPWPPNRGDFLRSTVSPACPWLCAVWNRRWPTSSSRMNSS